MLNKRNVLLTYFYIHILLFLFSFQISNCQSKNYFSIVDEEDTFTNVLKFENYQLNHFAKNNEGDFVVSFTEYTENIKSSSRKFYGLKNDGQYFFSDEESFERELKVNINEEIYNSGLDRSKNLFVYINDNTDKQYLFSINAYNSMVELFDVDNNDNKYYIWSFNKFFDLNLDEYYSPCSYEIFSLKKEKSYIIAFLPKEKISSDKSNAIFIKKFRFKSFDKNAFEEIKPITFESFENKKIFNFIFNRW